MEEMKRKLEGIEDRRHQSYVEDKLADILVIVMCAVLCGIDELSEMASYAKNKADFLRNVFSIEQIPSKPTFSRVLNMIDADKVATVVIEIMRTHIEELGEIIAVDGKAIRSTSKKGKAHSALQILTAYCTQSSVILGQKSIHEKTNEIPVFQEMLEYTDISGKTITADAMHCQKETCKKIIEKKGNYVFGLKENQKTLHGDVELFINDSVNKDSMEVYTSINKGSGRIEKRTCFKVLDTSWLHGKNEWIGLNTVFAVNRTTTTNHGVSKEMSYYITSLEDSAEKLLYITREHWKIESMHWLLDVVFSEDDCKILSENTLKSLNIFRKLALFMHKKYVVLAAKKQSLKSSMFDCLLNDDTLVAVIQSL